MRARSVAAGVALGLGVVGSGVLATPAAAQSATPPAAAPACRADPLDGRALYLRGSFNSWASADLQRFVWSCDRWELVTRLPAGELVFKIGDEGWSADADFGGAPGGKAAEPGAATALVPKGSELRRRLDAATTFRFTLRPPAGAATTPSLTMDTCPRPAPFGTTALALRGTMNNWSPREDDTFLWHCDAYLLNTRLVGRHEFRVVDASGRGAVDLGPAGPGTPGNFALGFDGSEQTLRLEIDEATRRPRLALGPRTFADPRARAVTDPVALSLAFDSRAAAHKRPFGAVPAGTTIDFEVTAAPGVERLELVIERRLLEGNQERLEYTEVARLPMARTREAGGTNRERFAARHRYTDVSVYGYWFEATIGGRRFALQNNTDAVFWTREKGTGGRASVGALGDSPAARAAIRRFRQTVHRTDLAVPDWAADVVWYYVFPERFRNGDKANDPRPGGGRAQDRYHAVDVERHARWLGRPYKPGSGDGSDAHFNNDFFGGDLAGLIEKLDHIRELGANTLYLTPIFRAASNHKYDTADWTQIDPAFGTNADFDRLVREAAKRGIRVVPDASFNHVGADSLYFDRYGNFERERSRKEGAFAGGKPNPASPYAGWFRFDPTQTEPDKQYRGWVGVADLPEIDKAHPGFRDFVTRAPDSITRRWLERGAAGWRMDVAPWVPDDFWREWRAAVKQTKPDALTVAETWFDSSKYFLGDMFDSTMNYIFRSAVLEYAAGGKAAALAGQLELMREAYPRPMHQALMNLLSSHDQARALHTLGWHDDPGDKAADAASIALAKRRFRLAVLFQMAYPGAPAVYYGDEVGVTGGDDPYNRAPFPWPDEGGQPDAELHAWFKRLIALRHAEPVLRRGELFAPLVADDHLLVLARRLDATAGAAPHSPSSPSKPVARWALVLTNNDAAGERRANVALPEGAPRAWRDALTGARHEATVEGAAARLTLVLPPLGGAVLLAD